MTRSTAFALLLLAIAVAGVMAGAMVMIERDRRELVDRFASERLKQVDEAAKIIDLDLKDVREDLLFAGELVQEADTAGDRARELTALMAVVTQYHRFEIYDAQGKSLLVVTDPLARPTSTQPGIDELMLETAQQALRRAPGDIVTTPPMTTSGRGWFRVFAASLPPTARRGGGAVAMLVDTEPLFREIRIVASDPASRLLLLGAHGRPTPASDPRLAEAATIAGHELPAYARLVGAMRAGGHGSMHLPGHEARALGLDDAEAVAAYASISTGSGHWSIATVTSTASLRAHERDVALRLGLASGAVIMCLLGFGGYVVVASRRAVALRERLRHADRLAHLHEKTEKILENIPTGVMALSTDRKIKTVNRALRERIPLSAIDAGLAAALPDALPSVVARLEALIDEALTSGAVRSLHGERLALFGEEGQYSVHAVPLEARFDEARVLLVVEDLSEVRSLESQLLRAEKLATVGVLAAGIAHEIGTPLGVVRGRAEYILGKLGTEHPQASGMTVIIEQIDRVVRTIRQLLDFSRVKPAVVRPVPVAQIARAVADLLRFEAERRKLILELDVPEELPPVSANSDQLQQVLVNLVMNAFDATRAGGRVTIVGRLDDTPEPSSWRRVRIDVVDDGCGIPEENQHQVFDPFFTTKKRGQGTGLGLTIAAEIVRNHGGQIELQSAAGEGTRVTLLWPSPTDGAEDRPRAGGSSPPTADVVAGAIAGS